MAGYLSTEILALKGRVYQLTAEFGDAFTKAAVALNTPPLTRGTLELVEECRAVGEVYEEALGRLLSALRREPGGAPGETARAENLKTQLHRELGLLASHPALRSQAGE